MKLLIISVNFLLVLCNNFSYGLDQSGNRIQFMAASDGHFEFIDTTAPIPTPLADVSDIQVFLYTQNNPTEPDTLTMDYQSITSAKNFDPKRKNIFIIHGWHNSVTSNVCVNVRSAYLQVLDANVFVIDWSSVSFSLYSVAFASIPTLGGFLGGVILEMQEKLGLASTDFMLVGHSLGAHFAGCAGAAANSKIGILVGLDPAGPLYLDPITSNRLDATDAEHVHVIHTNGGILGYNNDLGTVDIRPNGGSFQKGCGLDVTGSCAHGRSYAYFAESITNGGFTAWECDSLGDFNSGKCTSNRQSHLGGKVIDTSLSGTYYLATNSEEPYSQ